MQRLFSNFANGWPGTGLLLLRLLTGASLLHCGIGDLRGPPHFAPIVPTMIGAGAGILLLVGLWTPLAGSLVVVVEVWITISRSGDPWIPIMLATLGAGLAMVGPGAWSIDAQLFGRKHIGIPKR